MTNKPVNHYKTVPNVFVALEKVHVAIDEHGLDRMLHHLVQLRASQLVMSQIYHDVRSGQIFRRNYAASSAKTLNGERLSFANCFLRIICATSMPAIVAAAE